MTVQANILCCFIFYRFFYLSCPSALSFPLPSPPHPNILVFSIIRSGGRLAGNTFSDFPGV